MSGEDSAWVSRMRHTKATSRSASGSLIPLNLSAQGGARLAPATRLALTAKPFPDGDAETYDGEARFIFVQNERACFIGAKSMVAALNLTVETLGYSSRRAVSGMMKESAKHRGFP